MKTVNMLIGWGFLLCSIVYLVAAAHADAGWTGFGTVEEVHVDESGEFYVRTSGIDDDKSGCKNSGWYSHYSKAPGHEKIYEAVMVAFKENKAIKFWVAGTCNQWNYANFTAVSVTR